MRIITLFFLLMVGFSTGICQCNDGGTNAPRGSALIIGENNYPDDELENSVNDAVDIARSMGRLKFKVKLDTNVDLATLKYDIEQWTLNLNKDVEVAILYFAGHGAEIDGDNYIYPISANPSEKNKDRVRQATYSASTLLNRMETFNRKVNIVILDACRNDPTRGVTNSPVGHGLTNMKRLERGVLVAFPVAAGKKTQDGVGKRNSNYALAMLKNLELPNLSITTFFSKVHDDAAKLSQNKDSPFINSSIGAQNDVCLCCVLTGLDKGDTYRRGDTIFSQKFEQYKERAKVNTSHQSRYNLVTDTFRKAEQIIRSSIMTIFDSIKSYCNCQMAHLGQSNEYRAERFTSRVGFANVPYGDDLFYPTMMGEIKENEFYFTIFGETYNFPKLAQLEKDKGLNNRTILPYSIYNIDWAEISDTIKTYLSNRLEMLLRD